ncbi:MAG: hypothetical protein LBU24_04370 [Methanocalculaceae archaeon]|jgi:cobyric acid synthase|nr:hypothetical protein [Methanocalculaceae archaeon]
MSCNPYVTEEGTETGIAQATQALAACARLVVDMNPILLKPKGNAVSQIAPLGKSWKDMQIADYYKEIESLADEVVAAYYRLKNEYTNIIVEGAVSGDGLIFGTYMRGLFANAGAVDALVGYPAEKKGVACTPVGEVDAPCAALTRHRECCLDVESIVALSRIN